MATIIAHSGLELDLAGKKQLMAALDREISTVYKQYALYYHPCGEGETAGEARGQITFFVCVPDCATERKRQVCAALNRAVESVVGKTRTYQVITIFKYHDAVAVGVDGEMKCDR